MKAIKTRGELEKAVKKLDIAALQEFAVDVISATYEEEDGTYDKNRDIRSAADFINAVTDAVAYNLAIRINEKENT